ncbi:hypothetical protein GMDG_08944, partial [Pseudogymnoascus destructans 20631-21]
YERNHQEYDRHPEQEARAFHRRTGNAAEAEEGRDKCNHKKNNGPVQQIAHRTNSRAFQSFLRRRENAC